jgi:hypothetical protein
VGTVSLTLLVEETVPSIQRAGEHVNMRVEVATVVVALALALLWIGLVVIAL